MESIQMSILISFFLIFSVQSASAITTVDVVYSETANLFQILDCVSQWWNDSCGDEGAYRKEWVNHSKLTDADLDLLKKYSTLREKYYKNEDSAEKDPSKNRNGLFATTGAISADPIALAFYRAHDVEAALINLEPVVSKEDRVFLRLFYKHFKNGANFFLRESTAFAPLAQRVNAQLKDGQYLAFLDKVKQFYGVSFDLNYKALYIWWPLPNRDYAYAVGDQLVLSKNPKAQLSWPDEDVIFHEIVHTISARQSFKQKQALTQAFLDECKIDLKEKKNNIWEEPMAVAIGQMLFLKRFNPDRFKKETNWYRNAWVNKFSQAVFPLVEKAFAKNKILDVDFARAAGRACKGLR